MWPLLLLSVVSLSVVIERFFFILRSAASPADLVMVDDYCRQNKIQDAIYLGAKSKDAVARVLASGLRSADVFEETINAAVSEEVAKFEAGLPVLDTAITLAPLLGLLGTVTGMIKSFGLLGAAQLEAPVAITGGIAEALIATAFGLAIAICALIPFNLVQTKKDHFIRKVESKATALQAILKQIAVEPRKVAQI